MIKDLLYSLYSDNYITNIHFENGFNKLYNRFDSFILDYGKDSVLLKLSMFTTYCINKLMISKSKVIEMENRIKFLSNKTLVKQSKILIHDAIDEYFLNGSINDLNDVLLDLKIPYFYYEVVKKMINMSLDKSDTERSLTSEFIANSTLLKENDLILAFTILLERAEDLYLDVPNVLSLLSWFLARAIHDEVISRSILHRFDLSEYDMGYNIVEHVKKLLKRSDANDLLENIWILPMNYNKK